METEKRLANDFSGPLIFNYVWWVLSEARRRKIKRLYFLARDGHTLLRIAEIFCEKFQLDIDCRYLYCSRAALRMPTYFFIGDEAFDLLLLWGYYVTLKTVLMRADLTDEERKSVYMDCGLNQVDEDKQLSKAEFAEYSVLLKKSRVYRRLIIEKSRASYDDAIGYLKQERLFDCDTVAVVDSGWTGSVQRSLRQLLEFEGYKGEIVGFYFGMYERPKTFADGEYLTWFFDAGTRAYGKAVFCNNLFECLLSAPHGMTKGYKNDGSGYVPVMSPPPSGKELKRIEEQCRAISDYCEERVRHIAFSDFDPKSAHKDTIRRVARYMSRPLRDEAAYYSGFLFCDDVTEAYQYPLASEEQKSKLRDYTLLRRVFRKVTNAPPSVNRAGLFWAYGTASFLPKIQRIRYRSNVLICEVLKYTVRRKKAGKSGQAQINECKALVDRCDVVSFDVFDTLLYRVVSKPIYVFQLMEPWAEANCGITDFCAKRVAAEQRARRLSGQEDVTMDEIYDAMNIDESTSARLEKYEKDTERRVLRRDRFMAGLLEYCVDKGKHVIVISDMYQDREFIEGALRANGITGFDSIYISSEAMKTKASGTLYRYVIEQEKIKNKRHWLHIGDNKRSDYYVPMRLGIRAYLYHHGCK